MLVFGCFRRRADIPITRLPQPIPPDQQLFHVVLRLHVHQLTNDSLLGRLLKPCYALEFEDRFSLQRIAGIVAWKPEGKGERYCGQESVSEVLFYAALKLVI